MKKLTAILLALLAWTAYAADKQDALIVFKLTSDEATAGYLDQLDIQIAWTLTESGKYKVIKSSDLADDMLMPPAEALAFCKDEPECIADLGTQQKARWILYGDIKNSFDGKKILLHLMLIDVPGKKLETEKFGQLSKQEDLVSDAVALLRAMLGIEAEKAQPELAIDLTPGKASAEGTTKKSQAGSTGESGTISQAEKRPVIDQSELKKAVTSGAKSPASVTAQLPGVKSPWTNAWMWSAAGAGVAAMSAAVIMGVISGQKIDDAKTPGLDQPTAYGLYDDAKSMALGANIAYGIGAAALCAAALIFILDITGDEPATMPSLACNGTGFAGCVLGLSTRF
jgi:hypothetical protein